MLHTAQQSSAHCASQLLHALPGAGLKAAWYGAELFGDLLAQGKKAEVGQEASSEAAGTTTTTTSTPAPGVKSVEQVLESIRADYAGKQTAS